MQTIINKIRNLIQDNTEIVTDIFTYDSSSIFTLTESNPITITSVLIDDVSTVNYSFSSTTKKLTITTSMTSGEVVQIDYSCYKNYSDTEIKGYINSALYYLGIHGYENYEVESGDSIYPELTPQEEKLVALIASLLMSDNYKSIRLPDITISLPNDVSTDQRIAKVIMSFKRSGKIGKFELI
jgi:cellobiose-specific phosphotransferase system component IIC